MSEFKTASTEAMDEFEELEAATLTNWRPMVFVDGQWAGNALVFATKHEAEQNARALMYAGRWLRIQKLSKPPNQSITNGSKTGWFPWKQKLPLDH